MPFPWTDSQPLRFDQFMAAALHDPEHGYYARRIRGVGKSGDFTTTAMISPALGRAVAAWALRSLAQSKTRHLIELGPGEGVLAQAVISHFPILSRWTTRFHLVESSEPLRRKQHEKLGNKVRIHACIEDAMKACGGRACIYSNEFVDAFPVRRFRREASGWSELYLTPDQEIWRPCSELPESSYFSLRYLQGQIIEVHESYRQWWQAWQPLWRAGRMLTIDYGDHAGMVYHRKPNGSLRGYFMQQRTEGPALYQNPGMQDLTADVNFTDLAALGRLRGCVSQTEFLQPYADPHHPADQYSIDPHGAGGAFQLIEHEAQPPA